MSNNKLHLPVEEDFKDLGKGTDLDVALAAEGINIDDPVKVYTRLSLLQLCRRFTCGNLCALYGICLLLLGIINIFLASLGTAWMNTSMPSAAASCSSFSSSSDP